MQLSLLVRSAMWIWSLYLQFQIMSPSSSSGTDMKSVVDAHCIYTRRVCSLLFQCVLVKELWNKGPMTNNTDCHDWLPASAPLFPRWSLMGQQSIYSVDMNMTCSHDAHHINPIWWRRRQYLTHQIWPYSNDWASKKTSPSYICTDGKNGSSLCSLTTACL
jgi:hypothetical protein